MSFLSGLKSLLSSEQKIIDQDSDNPNFITQPSRIKHTLQQLMESHVHISIILADQSEHTSRLISVSKNGFIIDQLNSRAAHNKVGVGSAIQIQAKHNAIPFNFSSTVDSLAKGGGYFISMPERIYHPQKRDFFRIPLENIEKYKFSASIQYSENTLTGYLMDVSYGGISIAVSSNTYIKKGNILSPASLILKNGNTIHADFNVCSVRKVHQDGFTRIGCKLINITPAEKRRFHKFISESARERAKNSNLIPKQGTNTPL